MALVWVARAGRAAALSQLHASSGFCCTTTCTPTATLLDTQISDQIPYNDYFEYYAPDFQMHLTPSNMENHNTCTSTNICAL